MLQISSCSYTTFDLPGIPGISVQEQIFFLNFLYNVPGYYILIFWVHVCLNFEVVFALNLQVQVVKG